MYASKLIRVLAKKSEVSTIVRGTIHLKFERINSQAGTLKADEGSKSLTGQINEALCKVLCHNLCVVIQSVRELGIEAAFANEISPEIFLPNPSPRQR